MGRASGRVPPGGAVPACWPPGGAVAAVWARARQGPREPGANADAPVSEHLAWRVSMRSRVQQK
eukprot:1244309-Alexandrium_andersonii.AAC.1